MEIEKPNTKKKENFPNFFPFAQNLQVALELNKSSFINLDFLDTNSKDQEKASLKKVLPFKISESFSLESLLTNITDFAYFSLDSTYILALISGNTIYFIDLPKKPNCFFQLKETIKLSITEKKEKSTENAFEGIFKPTNLELESLNCCDFGYKLRTNGSKINFEEDETDLILACAGKTGLIYLITLEEDFPIVYLYGHINEVFCIKFAHPNPTFNFQNILLTGGKDGAIIMWNIKNEVKIVVFVPKQHPHSDILSLAWAPNCDYIASVGLDNVVKIWKFEHIHALKKKIEESHFLNTVTAKNFKKLEINSEAFRNKDAHQNFEYQIDQIEFYGYSFLTKDVFGNIVFWIPNFENQGCLVIKNFYSQQLYPNYFIKFAFSFELGIIAIGNDQGEIFIYDFLSINKQNNCLIRKYELENDQTLIKSVLITEDKNMLFVISRKKLYKFDLTSDIEMIQKIRSRNIFLQKK